MELAAVEYFLEGGLKNKTEACREAGYAHAHVQAVKVFKRPRVVAEIKKRLDEIAKKRAVTPSRIIEEYAKIAFSNLGDLLEVQPDGSAVLDLTDLTDDQRACITRFEGATDKSPDKISFADKKAALDSLARVYGMFNDKLTVKGSLSLVERLQKGRARVKKSKE